MLGARPLAEAPMPTLALSLALMPPLTLSLTHTTLAALVDALATTDARTVSVWSGVRWFVRGVVGCVRPGGYCCGRLVRGCSCCYRRLPPLLLPPPPLLPVLPLLPLPVVVLPVRCCRWWCFRSRWWCCRRRWCWC